MTVPPTPPPRPSDESPQHHDPVAQEHGTAPDTPPALAGSARTDSPASAPAPEQTQPAAPAPAPAPAYLSGIVTAGLAAICGAIFTSWAGVQGTLIGAMVGATIGSTVSEMVRAPLDALERRLIEAGVSARRVRQDGVVKTVMTSPTAAQQAFGMVSRGAVLSVGATAIVGFLLAVGGVTAVESASGQPLAATLGGDTEETGTTIGNVLPNPPAALAPAPTAQTTARSNDGTVAGRSGGGMTAYPPTVPPSQAVPPAAAPVTSPTPVTALVPGASPSPEPNQDSLAASPVASPAPEAVLAEAASPTPEPGSPPLDSAPAPSGSPVVQVVTVVVTATLTPSQSPTAAALATDQTPTATATATFTPTPTVTPTRTPTTPPGASTPGGSPASPAPPPQA